MVLTRELIEDVTGSGTVVSNVISVIEGLKSYGREAGLDKRHRLAHFLAQLAHESAGFRYDGEIWGPTVAQRGYEGRADLGNTEAGDGYKFRGRTAMMLTGRGNYYRFQVWCGESVGDHPAFVIDPDRVLEDPWEGLVPIWYWQAGNPTARSLNHYADENNIEMITRRINGGMNGYRDRLRYYTRFGLVLLGYGPYDVEEFQRATRIEVDGIPGPQTRSALHRSLWDKAEVTFADLRNVHHISAEDVKAMPLRSVTTSIEEAVSEERLRWAGAIEAVTPAATHMRAVGNAIDINEDDIVDFILEQLKELIPGPLRWIVRPVVELIVDILLGNDDDGA